MPGCPGQNRRRIKEKGFGEESERNSILLKHNVQGKEEKELRRTENKGQVREGLLNGESSEDFKLQSGVIRYTASSSCQQRGGRMQGR